MNNSHVHGDGNSIHVGRDNNFVVKIYSSPRSDKIKHSCHCWLDASAAIKLKEKNFLQDLLSNLTLHVSPTAASELERINGESSSTMWEVTKGKVFPKHQKIVREVIRSLVNQKDFNDFQIYLESCYLAEEQKRNDEQNNVNNGSKTSSFLTFNSNSWNRASTVVKEVMKQTGLPMIALPIVMLNVPESIVLDAGSSAKPQLENKKRKRSSLDPFAKKQRTDYIIKVKDGTRTTSESGDEEDEDRNQEKELSDSDREGGDDEGQEDEGRTQRRGRGRRGRGRGKFERTPASNTTVARWKGKSKR